MKQVISSVLLATVVFLIPSNLFLQVSDQFGYVNGIRIDYLILKLYASQLVGWGLLAWHLFTHDLPKITWSPWSRTVLGLIMLLLGMQFFSVLPVVSLWESFMLLQMGLLVWVFTQNKAFFQSDWFVGVLVLTLLFQSGLGLYQFMTQSSLASYAFLGETNLQSYAGLAKGTFNHVEKVLPYGTTAHPNVLAGVTAVYLTMLWWSIQKKSTILVTALVKLSVTLTSILALVVLFLTQSISGWLTLGIGASLILFNKNSMQLAKKYNWKFVAALLAIIISIIFILPTTNSKAFSFTRRAYLNQAALNMIQQRPQGFGLGTVTTQIEAFSSAKEIVRFIQPPHHVLLLWLAETGMIGLILLMISAIYLKNEQPSMFISILFTLVWLLPIISLDHYLITLQTGQLLTALSLGFYITRVEVG